MKLKIFLVTVLALFLFPVNALAASYSIRLGQPKSPTNQNYFRLTFVALDTQDDPGGRQITVRCFKKGPSDGGYSQFDVDKVMIPGGNTDYCDVTNSILNTNGSYSFYVTASVPSEPSLTSSTVTVDYNTSGPSTPVYYSKEKVNNCDYKIKFKTANDSKTIKVQLFRSDNLSINVDNGAVISSKNIGPDQEGDITNTVPDCNKNYYFVIRAVDSSDNVSGTVGDSFTTTTNTTSTGNSLTAGSTPGISAIPLTTGSQVTSPTGKEGQNGETTPSPETTVTITPEASPSVLGSSTDKGSFIKWAIVIGLLIAGYFLVFKKRKAE